MITIMKEMKCPLTNVMTNFIVLFMSKREVGNKLFFSCGKSKKSIARKANFLKNFEYFGYIDASQESINLIL